MSEVTEERKPSLIGMLTDPLEQFRRIKKRPVFWGALGIIIVIFIVGLILSFQSADMSISEEFLQEFARETGEEITEELKQVLAFAQNVGVFIGGTIGPIFGALIASVIHLLVGKIIHSTVSFRQLFSMNTYIMLITALGVMVNGLLMMIFQVDFGSSITSLGIFFNPEEPVGAMMSHIEVFAIWSLILTAFGLQKVANFSKTMAWGVPIIMFVVGMLFGV